MAAPQPSLLQSLRALPRAAWMLFFGTFLNKAGTFVIPFLTLYLTGRGYSLAAAGAALGAYGLGNIAASFIGGHMADRLGRRRTIVISMFSGALAMLLLSRATTWPELAGLSALAGLTGEMYRPASSALLADLVPPGQRVTAYAALRASFNAGWAFGPALAGFIAARGYFWLFVGDAITSALFGILALAALPQGNRAPAGSGGWAEVVGALRADRRLPRVLLAAFCISIVFVQQSSTLGLHVTRLGFPAAVFGVILSLNGAMVVCCELPLTTVTRKFARKRVIALGYLLCGFGFALNGVARSEPALFGCMALFTLGEMLALPTTSAYIADLAPPNLRGRYMGVYGMTWTLAVVVGPTLGMTLVGVGHAFLWIACAAFGAIAGALALTSIAGEPRLHASALGRRAAVLPTHEHP